jgi:hypothetical protein
MRLSGAIQLKYVLLALQLQIAVRSGESISGEQYVLDATVRIGLG